MLLRADLRQVNLPVVPVQLLSQAVHLLHQLALGGPSCREDLGPECQQVGEAPGLGLLDVGEGGFEVLRPALSPQGHPHQALVHRELVLQEADLQLVLLKMAPEVLETGLRGAVRPERVLPLTQRLLGLSEQEVGPVAQLGCIGLFQTCQGGEAHRLGRPELPDLQVHPSQQQLAEGRTVRQAGVHEEPQRRLPNAPGLELAAFLLKDESSVGVDEGGPDAVVLPDEHLSRLFEQAESPERFALPPGTDGQVGQGLRRLVSHSQGVEALKGL